jgi:hypothetical protein
MGFGGIIVGQVNVLIAWLVNSWLKVSRLSAVANGETSLISIRFADQRGGGTNKMFWNHFSPHSV